MYKKYYSYNDMPKPIFNKPEECKNTEIISKSNEHTICKKEQNNGIFGKFETDDIILAAVIVMLLANDCDDKLLLLAIVFIFLNKGQ